MSRVTDKALQTALEKTRLYVDTETDKLRGNIPAKLSQLKNDNHTVTDAEYVHTDNNYSDADKAVVGSLPATILTNPHVIASGGETYLNVSYDMAELVDGAYSTTTKTVSIPAANSTTNRAGLLSGPDKIIIDSLPGNIINVFGANTYTADKVTIHYTKADKSPYGGHIKYGDPKPLSLDIPGATSTKAGVMRADDKAKLDGIEEGANNYVLPHANINRVGGVKIPSGYSPTIIKTDKASVPLEAKIESTADALTYVHSNIYVDDVPTEDSNRFILSGAVHTAIDKAKMQVFIDLWNQACNFHGTVYGKYDPINAPAPDKPFMLYGLWFSYSKALHIYNISYKEYVLKPAKLYFGISHIELPAAFLPLKVLSHSGESCERVFSGNIKLKACHIAGGQSDIYGSSDWRSAFEGCANLETIYGGVRPLYSSPRVTDCFKGCSALKEVVLSLRYVGINISLEDSPLISLQSLQNSIATSVYTESANTITVHPDVYAKLTGDTTNDAAAALTEEEAAAWQQIVVDAAAKNISFATV